MGNGHSAPSLESVYPELAAEKFPSSQGTIHTLKSGRSFGYNEYSFVPSSEIEGVVISIPGSPHTRLFFPSHWRPVVEKMKLRVLVLERPGTGLSSPNPEVTPLSHAQDVEELVDALGLGKFALVGYSGGGPWAMAVAHHLSSCITGAAIVSCVGPPSTPNATQGMSTTFKLATFLNRNIPWGVAQIVKMGEKEFPKDPVNSGRADWANYHPRDRERYVTDRDMEILFLRTQLELHSRGQLASSQLLDFQWFRQEWGFELSAVRARVKMYHGALDLGCTPEMARYVSKQIPGCELEIWEDRGHLGGYFDEFERIIQWALNRESTSTSPGQSTAE